MSNDFRRVSAGSQLLSPARVSQPRRIEQVQQNTLASQSEDFSNYFRCIAEGGTEMKRVQKLRAAAILSWFCSSRSSTERAAWFLSLRREREREKSRICTCAVRVERGCLATRLPWSRLVLSSLQTHQRPDSQEGFLRPFSLSNQPNPTLFFRPNLRPTHPIWPSLPTFVTEESKSC